MVGVALVTGASSGIGLSTSIELAKAGFAVVATMRDVGKASGLGERARAEKVEVDVQPLDVTDPDAIEVRVRGVMDRHGHIDVLVNNAGAGHLGTLEQTTLEEARHALEVNFFGVWNTTRAVLPHMRTARSGRIISLSSVGGIVGQPFNDAYCAAKFAVEGMMESLAPVMRRFGVFVSIIEPGAVNTEFVSSVARSAGGLLAAEDDPYRPLLDAYLTGTTEVFAAVGQTGDDVARVIVEVATADSPHLRYQTSPMARRIAERKFADPDGDSVIALSGGRLPSI